MESWVFLLVGGLGAVGAAMALGTIAAMVRYQRTGTLPGTDDEGATVEGQVDPARDPAVLRRLVVRIVLGIAVAVVCFWVLAEQGLLGGPVLG